MVLKTSVLKYHLISKDLNGGKKGRETKIYHCARIYPMNVTFKEIYISHWNGQITKENMKIAEIYKLC